MLRPAPETNLKSPGEYRSTLLGDFVSRRWGDEHFTVIRGEDPEQAADAAEAQYFVCDFQKYNGARKITVQLNERDQCEVRFDEPGEAWDGESVPTEY